ncbi:MAG: hypothetical protein K8L97_06995 [Anaerolineae bacterium]|nr:hypothetical protein [Anaerolineae bacterium]
MNITRKAIIAFVLVCVLAVSVAPAFAQEVHTKTITEAEVNEAYIVTNPPRRTITDVYVDLQPGQVVVTATYTVPGKEPIDASVTLVPSITNGRLYWIATAASANGESVSADLLAQINASISSAWRNYVRQQAPVGRLSSIEITDDAITLTGVSR